MRGRTASYLRREDGVLQIVTPTPASSDTLGIEGALAFLGVTLGGAAVMTGHAALAALLVVTGFAHPGARIVRKIVAAWRTRIRVSAVRPASGEPIGLRVVRLETPVPAARVPGAVRLPDTAASPQE